MSAYMGFHPEPGKTDAERDLICMITTHGGTNPLEAGAFVVDLVRKTLQHGASGVRLRELTSTS
jgi:ethanolamine ammonia-lyase small subunit